jgi:hypothetical protein
MPLWGIEERLSWLDSLGVSVKELVQAWWTLETIVSPNKMDVIHLHKGVKKYITHPRHYLQESQVALIFLFLNLLSTFVLK